MAKPRQLNVTRLAKLMPNLTELDVTSAAPGELGHTATAQGPPPDPGEGHKSVQHGGVSSQRECTVLGAALRALPRLQRLAAGAHESALFQGRGGCGACVFGIPQLLALRHAPRLVHLGLCGQPALTSLTPGQWGAILEPLSSLASLDVGGVPLRAEALRAVAEHCPHLTALELAGSSYVAAAVVPNGQGAAPGSNGDGSSADIAGPLACLSYLPFLAHLNISRSDWPLPAAGSGAVLPRLSVLEAEGWGCSASTGNGSAACPMNNADGISISARAAGLSGLAETAPALAWLRMSAPRGGLDAQEAGALCGALHTLTALRGLDLSRLAVVETESPSNAQGALNEALVSLTLLSHLDLAGCSWLTLATARALLQRVPSLQRLVLAEAEVWDTGAAGTQTEAGDAPASRAAPSLTHLDLGRVRIRAAGFTDGHPLHALLRHGLPLASTGDGAEGADDLLALPQATHVDLSAAWSGLMDLGEALGLGDALAPPSPPHDSLHQHAGTAACDQQQQLQPGQHAATTEGPAAASAGARGVQLVLGGWTLSSRTALPRVLRPFLGASPAPAQPSLAEQQHSASSSSMELEGTGGSSTAADEPRPLLPRLTGLDLSSLRVGPALRGREAELLGVLGRVQGLAALNLAGFALPQGPHSLAGLRGAASSLVSLNLAGANPPPGPAVLRGLGALTGLHTLVLDVPVSARSHGGYEAGPAGSGSSALPSALSTLTRLTHLSARGLLALDDACLEVLAGQCLELSTLVVEGCPGVSARGVEAVARSLCPVRVLSLSWPQALDATVVRALARSPTLRVLSVQGSSGGSSNRRSGMARPRYTSAELRQGRTTTAAVLPSNSAGSSTAKAAVVGGSSVVDRARAWFKQAWKGGSSKRAVQAATSNPGAGEASSSSSEDEGGGQAAVGEQRLCNPHDIAVMMPPWVQVEVATTL